LTADDVFTKFIAYADEKSESELLFPSSVYALSVWLRVGSELASPSVGRYSFVVIVIIHGLVGTGTTVSQIYGVHRTHTYSWLVSHRENLGKQVRRAEG
jgi:hypothetical protein